MKESKNYISLLELNNRVKRTLAEEMGDTYWVKAEISEINEHYNGHCYLELVENDDSGKKMIAKARATIWSFHYRMIKPYFHNITAQNLSVGMKILVKVKVVFHELYSFSLNIIDLDPVYTLGDMEKARQEIIKRLKDEGVFEMNKEHHLPELPQRIAVISSETAAGYGDFSDQIINNHYGYRFSLTLYNATMQGDAAEASIVDALDLISNDIDKFDAVVLIRGGGAKTDLKCFDSYLLCANIAQYPIPVITGIGHERDESIADMVAHTSLKTPTAVAEFLISAFVNADEHIMELQHVFINMVNSIVNREKQQLENITGRFVPVVQKYIAENRSKLELYPQLLEKGLEVVLKNEKNRIEKYSIKSEYMNPEKLLERGYAIVSGESGIIKSARHLKSGDNILIKLKDGTVDSVVRYIEKRNSLK